MTLVLILAAFGGGVFGSLIGGTIEKRLPGRRSGGNFRGNL